MKIECWLQNTIKLFSHLYTPKLDAEIILSYVLQKSRSWIKIFDNIVLNDFQINKLTILVQRRIKNEPIAYIIKKKEFWSLPLKISQNVLIPRPDTEILVEHCLNRLKKKDNVLDLGCGCGAISLAIAKEKPKCKIIGIDYTKEAIVISNKNAACLNLKNVNFYYSNWFSKIKKKFHLIVSNPPYLKIQDILYIEKDILFEPITALISGKDGLLDIDYIIRNSKKFLFSGGWLLIEHGWNQQKIVFNLFKKYGFLDIKCYKDYQGNDRVIAGKK